MRNEIHDKVKEAVTELLAQADVIKGGVFILGCSTSEIAGGHIGKNSAPEIGAAVVEAALSVLNQKGIYLAVQCCEHLNRAVVLERAAAEKYALTRVWAKPVPGAGGSAAAAAWEMFNDPVLVESVLADAGMDIGETLIGMHLRPVAVPVRISFNMIGNARLTLAKTRPKYIGGPRAVYR